MVSPATSRIRTLLMSRRVREGGFSAQADLPSSWCTRERIRSILSAMINSVVRASPSGVSVEGTSYVASSVSRSNHSCKRQASSRAASSYRKSSICARVMSCTRAPMARSSLRTTQLDSYSVGHWHGGAPRALQQRVPLSPEGTHLQLVIHQWLRALHATRDVRPLHLAIGKTLLA